MPSAIYAMSDNSAFLIVIISLKVVQNYYFLITYANKIVKNEILVFVFFYCPPRSPYFL